MNDNIIKEQARHLLYKYYGWLMDDFNGSALEKELAQLLDELYPENTTICPMYENPCDDGELVPLQDPDVLWQKIKKILEKDVN